MSRLDDLVLQHRVEQFLYCEARLIDERRFADWEALWDDDAIYWVPANGDDPDPDRDVSLIHDNRSRLHSRLERFAGGTAISQQPPPRTAHIVANVTVERRTEPAGTVLTVHGTVQVAESRPGHRVDWVGRTTHLLVERDGELRIRFKKVLLVDNDQELTSLDFIL